jgi:hypothetical protein
MENGDPGRSGYKQKLFKCPKMCNNFVLRSLNSTFHFISGVGVAVIDRKLYAVGGYDGVRRLDR